MALHSYSLDCVRCVQLEIFPYQTMSQQQQHEFRVCGDCVLSVELEKVIKHNFFELFTFSIGVGEWNEVENFFSFSIEFANFSHSLASIKIKPILFHKYFVPFLKYWNFHLILFVTKDFLVSWVVNRDDSIRNVLRLKATAIFRFFPFSSTI